MQLDELPGNLILTNRTIRKVALALASGGSQSELRAGPTRRLAGGATKRVFGTLAVENALAARMNATDLELGQHMPHAVARTRLPYPLYMFLSVLFSLVTTLVAPLVTATIVSLMALIQSEPHPKNGFWNFLIGPAIYLGLLTVMFVGLPVIKWILFPRRMRPGVYPLYGWTYLRWDVLLAWPQVLGCSRCTLNHVCNLNLLPAVLDNTAYHIHPSQHSSPVALRLQVDRLPRPPAPRTVVRHGLRFRPNLLLASVQLPSSQHFGGGDLLSCCLHRCCCIDDAAA
jgi:hypothetical protein